MANVVSCPVPILRFVDNQGNALVGGQLLTQVGGINTATYQDSAGTTPLPNPIILNSRGEVADSSGHSQQMFPLQGVTYTFTLSDASGNLIYTANSVAGITANNLGQLLWPTQAIETAASVTPDNFQYMPLDPRRYASIANWSAVYAVVSSPADTDWPYYRGDHAQHPTQTNAIVGFKTADDSLSTGTVSWHSTYLGAQAGQFNGQSVTAGGTNTGIGFASLQHNVEGSGNTAVGPETLNLLTGVNSSHNNCFGYRGCALLTAGTQNNTFGFTVLTNLTKGNNNHGFGESVMVSMTIGNANHLFGYQAGFSIPVANYAHGIGYQVLFNQNAGTITNLALGASTTVTVSVVSATNPFNVGGAIGFENVGGTTQINGLFGSVTAIGGSSGAWTATVSLNSTGFGAFTSGGSAFPVGNTCFGYRAAPNLSYGSANVVIGHQAGEGNLIGDGCVLMGYQAGQQKNDGFGDVAIGFQALLRSVHGGNNTVIGQQAGNSIGVGPVTATDHVVIGANAGQGIVGALRNVCIGSTSGINLNGNNNTSVGFNAGTQGSVQTFQNCGTFGANAVPTGSNQITLGDTNITTIRAQVTTITAISDERDKSNIEDLSLGLDFINTIKPRQFKWARRDGSKPHDHLEAGVIAQELLAAQTAAGAEWLDLVLAADPDRLEATPGKLLFPLIKAVQQLSAKVAVLEARLTGPA